MSFKSRHFVGSAALVATSTILLACIIALNQITSSEAKRDSSPNRKSIVFDLKTPKVFYCPQEKPSDADKTIVKAQPLDKLCEFEGRPKPKHEPSDCYNDVDESEFACDEKRRFMIRLDLAGEVSPSEGLDDLDYIMTKSTSSSSNGKKKVTTSGKKY